MKKYYIMNNRKYNSIFIPLLSILQNGLLLKLTILFPITFLCVIVNGQNTYLSCFNGGITTYNVLGPITCYTDDLNNSNDVIFGCSASYSIVIDTSNQELINDHFYYHITNLSMPDCYVRENTLEGKIYRYIPEIDSEFVMCDFSLDVGDTFFFPTFDDSLWTEYYFSENGLHTIVDSITYHNGAKVLHLHNLVANYYGTSYFFLSNNYPFVNLKFIEGVGPTFGPLGYHPTTLEHYLPLLLCQTVNDSLKYLMNEEVGCFHFEAKIEDHPKEEILIYPNPAQNVITINYTDNTAKSGILYFIDAVGRVIKTINMTSDVIQVDISNFSDGFYTLVYTDKKRKSVAKFVVNR